MRESEREINTGDGRAAGEQSVKNANIYEKINALEHQAEICNRVSLVILRVRH